MADVTTDLLRSIDTEPHKWLRKRVVAFVPHERLFPEIRDESNKVVRPECRVKVTEAELRRDATEANERIRRTGQLDALTIGHRRTEPGFPEKDQPPLVGFCRDYSVDLVSREAGPMLALTYEECVPKDREAEHDLYRQYPYRSVDYAPAGLGQPGTRLSGVAALVRPPYLNMGTVYVYQQGAHRMAGENEAWDADDEAGYPEFQTYAAKVGGARLKKYMAKYEAAAGPANGVTPELAAYQATFDARIKALEAETATAKRKAVEADCERHLDRIAHLVKFDRKRELGTLVAYQSDAERMAHLTYMTDHYEKLPTGTGVIRVYAGDVQLPGADNPADPFKEPANHQAILTYMRESGETDYHKAKAKVGAK